MRNARVDKNQTEIVKALRKIGCTVQHLHAVGKGCPDLLVGYKGFNILLEVKDGGKSISAQKLTEDQVVWHRSWNGHVDVVNTVESSILAVYQCINELSDIDDLK